MRTSVSFSSPLTKLEPQGFFFRSRRNYNFSSIWRSKTSALLWGQQSPRTLLFLNSFPIISSSIFGNKNQARSRPLKIFRDGNRNAAIHTHPCANSIPARDNEKKRRKETRWQDWVIVYNPGDGEARRRSPSLFFTMRSRQLGTQNRLGATRSNRVVLMA